MPIFAMPLEKAADMLRRQPCLVRTENPDNSLYARTKSEVVQPIVYYCIRPALVGWAAISPIGVS